MPSSILIKNALTVNEGKISLQHILVEGEIIARIDDEIPDELPGNTQIIDARGKLCIPGVIDDQVHFREPGLTHKGDIETESRAACAGGITSYMEMPNTVPQTLTLDLLNEKFESASKKSIVNYSFYMGASNDNLEELKKVNPKNVCGIKVFMGASTGNMLVDNPESLRKIFSLKNILIACHCEDEATIQKNLAEYKKLFSDDIPTEMHPQIRSAEACFLSSSLAVNLAKELGTRLHVLHLSTARETELFDKSVSASEKQITSEVCVHHLWFSDADYAEKGNFIKWNPAVKSAHDREMLRRAVIDNKIDIVATDHAPHTFDEKKNAYLKAPSGGPLVQHALLAMIEMYKNGIFTLEKIVEKMCHTPADIFKIEKRGYLREGYFADLVLIDLDSETCVNKDNILYKCAWSPFEGTVFHSRITHTFINGNLAYENGVFNKKCRGKALDFNR